MVVIGEIKRGRDLGKKYKNGAYIFVACEICGSERWVEYRDGKPKDARCYKCVNKGKSGIKLTHPNKNIVAQVGDIKTGEELGLHFKSQKYIYESCPNCGNNRWVQIQTAGKYLKCRKCLNKGRYESKNARWNGGRKMNPQGYMEVRLLPSDPYIKMAKKSRYVLEHRLVVAKALGRCLDDFEIVHHKDSNPQNNSLDNLELIGDGRHNTMVEKTIKKNEKRIKELESKIIKLEAELTKKA